MKLWQRQFVRYGLVGIVSTGVHVAVAFLLLWSFETKGELVSLGKFAVASSVTLTLIVLISNAVNLLRLPPYTGILMVAVIIPLVGFVLQKLWVFNR